MSRAAKTAVIALVVLVYLLVPYRWANSRAHSDSVAARTANQARAALQLRIAHARDVLDHPAAWRGLQTATTAAFPPTVDVSGVLADLRAVAASSGASLVSFDATPSPSGDPPTVPTPVAVTLRIEGSLTQVEAFLSGIRGMPRLVTTSTLSVAQGETLDADLTSDVWVGPGPLGSTA